MNLNTCFKELLCSNMLHCNWNSIQIHNVASFFEIEDSTLKGCIVNVSVGKDTAGSFSVRGTPYSADGDIAISSSRNTVKCYAGRKPWTLLRFALEKKEESIDGFDKQYLSMLGFSLRTTKDQSAVADVDKIVTNDQSVSSDEQATFIHCCCEKESLLSRPTEGKDMKIIDIVKEDDFTKSSTVKRIVKQLRGPGDVFFYCSPCTGGSTWQRLNL